MARRLTLPNELRPAGEQRAAELLKEYYTRPHRDGQEPNRAYTGALFDTWDTPGTREADADCFTPDDLLAVTCLSVDIPPRAASRLLTTQAATYNALLQAVGEDRHLVTVDPKTITKSWEPWQLYTEVRNLPGVGRTRTSKLLARKRPKLIPIQDEVVHELLGSPANFWVALCVELRDHGLHERLLDIHGRAGAHPAVTPLRVFDVIAWMVGKGFGPSGAPAITPPEPDA